MVQTPRREFLSALGAAVLLPLGGRPAAGSGGRETPRAAVPVAKRFRIRTLTAGVTLRDATDLRPIDNAIAFLNRARKRFEGEGYEVQTLRIATQPFLRQAGVVARRQALEPLQVLDRWVSERNVLISIGPAVTTDRLDPDFAPWAAELIRTTRNINTSVSVASPTLGVHGRAARVAAEAIQAISRTPASGVGNFRFAAAANILPGTPFFPVAVHEGPDALAIGLELARRLGEVLDEARRTGDPAAAARRILDADLRDVQRIAEAAVANESRTYLGIDPSPAPSKDSSIAAVIESISGVPFGSASTLRACARLTDVLRSLTIRTCGYAGLMLPVLEDPVLARRAGEGRYGLRDLLLFSSVCGTGLDVVPVPGDTPVDVLTAIVTDVAAVSAKLRKPLSVRLLPIPGRHAGQLAHFDETLLTDSVIFKTE